MAKPKIPNQKKKYQELNNRLNRYVALVEQIYDTLNLEVAKAVSCTDYSAESDKPFKCSSLMIFIQLSIEEHPRNGRIVTRYRI